MKHFPPYAKRRAAWFLIGIMVAQLFTPYQSFALTGGPSQPEVQSFEPIGTSEMVDVSSGSFTYNIPLLEVGGYPINLAYHSGVTPDEEASVCGLGWNINPGVVNRNMRGLPDDFSGDEIKKEFNIKPNKTWGGSIGFKMEMFGWSKKKSSNKSFSLGANLGMMYNNYKGVGFEFGLMPGFSAGMKGSGTASFGLGLTANSQTGISVSPSVGFERKKEESEKSSDRGNLNGGISVGTSINSREGMSALTMKTKIAYDKASSSAIRKALSSAKYAAQELGLLGGESTFSFAAPTYSPAPNIPYQNYSFSGSFSVGFEITGWHPGGHISGYYSEQSLAQNQMASPAYGYLYAHDGQGNDAALMDFNREKDGPFTKHTPHLPLAVFTNDIYGVTGQGIAGSYQLKRGDIGTLSDARMETYGSGNSIGVEIGFGAPPGVHGGGDIVINTTDSHSGAWTGGNDAAGKLPFEANTAQNPNYEPAYFKIAGEKSVETDAKLFYENGGKDPVRAHIEKGNITQMNVKSEGYFETEGNVKYPINRSKRERRERRNQSITYLTANEAKDYALEKTIKSYALNTFPVQNNPTQIQRTGTGNFRKGHHLSEITLLRQDGLRYVYGIPAYNIAQEEVSFSVNNMGDCQSGLVKFAPSDTTIGNQSGEDQYFNKIKTPAYAHSFLLTAIVSQDYVDLKNDGPTPDDYGTYTKFNYTRVVDRYNWRVPIQQDLANFNEGLKSRPEDNKANYVSGVKEYWVLHSVESKTQVAEFFYNDPSLPARPDGLSATGQKLPRLDHITLYSWPDRNLNTTPTAIKTVYFEYDNSLCPGLPYSPFNAALGKLTLKKLWFTYGDSKKGRLSPYQFWYGERWDGQIFNPTYNLKAYNRWGTYMPNKGVALSSTCFSDPKSDPLNTSDNPYVPQGDTATANQYATAYNLTRIKLPSGGQIKVEYEANHYAYTQDRRAMEMIEVVGAGDSPNGPGGGDLFKHFGSSDPNFPGNPAPPNNFIFFKLRKPIPNNDANELWRQYLEGAFGNKSMGDGYLHFKFLVNCGQFSKPAHEFVSGYTQIKSYGVATSNNNFGYVELSAVPFGDLKLSKKVEQAITNLGLPNPNEAIMTNPIAKTAWQFTRLYLPQVAYDQATPTTNGLSDEDIIKNLAKSINKQAMQFALGFNRFMLTNNYGRHFEPGKSWIRLCSPEKDKIAGGSRVKKIRISDEWGDMDKQNGKSFEYGEDYDYTTIEGGNTISSGVAAYEPMPGGEENPFRQPVFFKEKAILAPDNSYYQEEPFGESFFPSPQIVYSKVTVSNRHHPDIERTATGWVVHEYYTARDFPTKTDDTGVRAIPKKTNAILKQLLFKHKDYMTAAEGFSIELNDMHGKPKAQWVYDEGGTRLSGVEYKYKCAGDQLINESIPVIDPFGNMTTANVGLEMSMVNDSREVYSKTRTVGVQLNTDNFMAGVYPVLTVIPLPSFHAEETRFRSMVTTKVIQRYGLLEKTIAYDLGASVSTENLAWDAETGEVILTRTENEFHDPIFSLNIPAHWGYEGMRGAYQNVGAEFSITTNATGIYNNLANQHFFTPGDELIKVNGNQTLWVKDVNRGTGDIFLIDVNGAAASSLSGTYKIARSGRRNQQLNSIGAVTSLKIPLNAAGNALNFNGKEILSAGAAEFSDRWQTWCYGKDDNRCFNLPGNPENKVNPYRTNNRGVYRPLRNWTYLTDRKQTAAGANIRTDGAFEAFSSFWQLPPNGMKTEGYPVWLPTKSGWTWTSEVTRHNPVGNELETRDTLDLYTAELVGYANTQVVATAQNARYRQIAFDGFEDYVFEGAYPTAPCYKRHLQLPNNASTGAMAVTPGISHSGKYALQLSPAATAGGKVDISSSILLTKCPTPLAPKPANVPFRLDNCDCVGTFSPDPGKYIFSAWVREDRPANALAFAKTQVVITVSGQTVKTATLQPQGPIIEGWQRISGEFEVPASPTSIVISLQGANDATTWFDDLRVHPFDAGFKSFVYDERSLRFTYELDENNFFTKYEYDQQGMLERVKKETERGVMTIQESRFGQKKQ